MDGRLAQVKKKSRDKALLGILESLVCPGTQYISEAAALLARFG